MAACALMTSTTIPTTPLPMPDSSLLKLAQARVPTLAEALFAQENRRAERLIAAMHYAVSNGGKRVRPALVYGAALAAGAEPVVADRPHSADAAALAVECVHSYSLVHDDLPCMDNDDLRRGKPTTHKAFDEGSALLAGDGLQSLAFWLLANSDLPADLRSRQLAHFARACADMVVGQALDVAAEGQALNEQALAEVHRHKTGALIRSAVALGGLAANADAATLNALDRFADRLGLAFQVQDDVLDVIGDTATLGKTAGKDQAVAKSTYPALMGLAAAQALAKQLHDDALAALAPLGDKADGLRELAAFLVSRDY
jgi:geranylgeranyl pyrophosphate synthase